ncbi:MAG: hypothetical protein R2856_32820 [Caldilineaceae bacterium]
MFYFLLLLTAFVLSFALTPLSMRLGVRLGLVDRPGGRRKHRGVIARTGGMALYAAFVITVLLTLALPRLLPPHLAASWFPPRNDPNEVIRLTALLVGATVCVAGGLLDDRYQFSSLPQYGIQFLAAQVAIVGLIFIKHVNNPFGEGFLFGAVNGFPLVDRVALDGLLVHGHDEHCQLAGWAKRAGGGGDGYFYARSWRCT